MRRPTRVLAMLAVLAAGASALVINEAFPAQATITGGGLWKVDCLYSHSNYDDPIKFPGVPQAGHRHDFYGNSGTNAFSTYSSMIGVTSTCTHKDTGAYWTPSLYRNGVLMKPDKAIVYYDVRAYLADKIEAFPPNFKMIGGNAEATTAAAEPGYLYWGCSDDTNINYKRRTPPTNCNSQGIMLRVQMPSCWDGVTVAGNEIAHMASPGGGHCPAGYPHVLPAIDFHVTYPLHSTTTGNITFSSGSVYSAHLDFWNTWDQATLQTLTTECLNTGQKYGPNCGHFKSDLGTPGKAAPKSSETETGSITRFATGNTPPTTTTPVSTTPPTTTAPTTTAPSTTAPSTTPPTTTAPSTTPPSTTGPTTKPTGKPTRGWHAPCPPKGTHKAPGGVRHGTGPYPKVSPTTAPASVANVSLALADTAAKSSSASTPRSGDDTAVLAVGFASVLALGLGGGLMISSSRRKYARR